LTVLQQYFECIEILPQKNKNNHLFNIFIIVQNTTYSIGISLFASSILFLRSVEGWSSRHFHNNRGDAFDIRYAENIGKLAYIIAYVIEFQASDHDYFSFH